MDEKKPFDVLQKALDSIPMPQSWIEEDEEDSSRDQLCDNSVEVQQAIDKAKELFVAYRAELELPVDVWLTKKAKTYEELSFVMSCLFLPVPSEQRDKEIVAFNKAKWVSVDEIQARLIDREQLAELTLGMVLGQPAIFPYVETEFDKGYSKGYYDAKEQVEEKIKELLASSGEKTK